MDATTGRGSDYHPFTDLIRALTGPTPVEQRMARMAPLYTAVRDALLARRAARVGLGAAVQRDDSPDVLTVFRAQLTDAEHALTDALEALESAL